MPFTTRSNAVGAAMGPEDAGDKAPAVVSVSHLRKEFSGTTAVDDLSFDVLPGEIFGLLGPNGAGKTTTLRVLLDMVTPDSGRVALFGRPPGKSRRRLGYLPEGRGLYGQLKVRDVLRYFAELKGLRRADAADRIPVWLDRVQLGGCADRKVEQLSRGMQRRVQLVAAVLHDPDLVILDEPFQGLDPLNVQRVQSLIGDLRTAGATVVLSTHLMGPVESLCDRILLVHRGRSVLEGTVEEVRRGAANRIRIRVRGPLPDLPGDVAVTRVGRDVVVTLPEGVSADEFLALLTRRRVSLDAFEVGLPLHDIFVDAVSAGDA